MPRRIGSQVSRLSLSSFSSKRLTLHNSPESGDVEKVCRLISIDVSAYRTRCTTWLTKCLVLYDGHTEFFDQMLERCIVTMS